MFQHLTQIQVFYPTNKISFFCAYKYLTVLTVFCPPGTRWWRQTHSAFHPGGGVRVQPLSSALVSLDPRKLHVQPMTVRKLYIQLFLFILFSKGKRRCKNSLERQSLWRFWGPFGRRGTSLKNPRTDFRLMPCWLCSGDCFGLVIQFLSFNFRVQSTIKRTYLMQEDTEVYRREWCPTQELMLWGSPATNPGCIDELWCGCFG